MPVFDSGAIYPVAAKQGGIDAYIFNRVDLPCVQSYNAPFII